MDDCVGTLALIVVLFSVTGIVVTLQQRARRRREEEEQARTQAQSLAVWQRQQAELAQAEWQRQQAYASWQQQQAEQQRRQAEAAWQKQQAEAEWQRQHQQVVTSFEASQRAAAEQARIEAERARIQAEQARLAALTGKFGPENAARVMRGEIWQGQTAEMLVEALGKPADIDEKVLKTKTRHIYKYRPMGANRYRLRITLENGLVVGWEDKG